ncbi:MAG: hypothetical protein M3346_05005 [Actinomycetota bacterium]|nr:hypothetical protein [Actinomycetota bacterium]
MLQIEPFTGSCLSDLRALINCHTGAVVPGWALSESFITGTSGAQPG